jgi:pyrroloquinoline quinone biosynthesis protein D
VREIWERREIACGDIRGARQGEQGSVMSPINADTVFVLNEQASLQSAGDGAVILLADSGQLYTCNETTEAFLKNVDGIRSFAEIVTLFVEEFEIDAATAERDLGALSNDLVAEGILDRR